MVDQWRIYHALPSYGYLPHSFIGNEQVLTHIEEGWIW